MKLALAKQQKRLWQWFTMSGRLRLAQPVALLPGPLALILGITTPYRWIFFVAYVYVLLFVIAYSWVRILGPKIILLRRLEADWAQVGDTLKETWQLTNHSWLPLLWLEIRDASSLPGYNTRRVAALGSNDRQEWQTTTQCEQRGVYQLGPYRARLSDPFGLLHYEWHDDHTRAIVIYPPLVRLPFEIAPQGQRGGLARADLLQQHVTPSVGGLREYVRGDPPSRIHWPTVARTNRLMIKEFDQDRAGALWVVLDLARAAHRSDEPAEQSAQPLDIYKTYTQSSVIEQTNGEVQFESAVELSVALACSLAAAALAEGRSVGLVADDGQRRLVAPGSGQHQLWRILSSLVDAEATGEVPLAALIGQTGSTHGALAVVTPALDGTWLPNLVSRGRSEGALVLLVAAQAAQAQPLAVRLAAHGVATHVFAHHTSLPLLNPPRQTEITRISPFGKLIKGAT